MNEQTPVNDKLPFWGTIGNAYSTSFNNFGYLLKFSWPLMVIFILGFVVIGLIIDQFRLPYLVVLQFILGFLLWAMWAVNWHRSIILNEKTAHLAFVRLRNIEFNFLGYSLLLVLIIIIPILLSIGVPILLSKTGAVGFIHRTIFMPTGVSPGLSSSVIFIISMIPAFLVYIFTARLVLVLPASAIEDSTVNISRSWRITTGNTIQLFFGAIFVVLPINLLFMLIERATIPNFPNSWMLTIVLLTISVFGYIFVMALSVSFISHAYLFFVQKSKT